MPKPKFIRHNIAFIAIAFAVIIGIITAVIIGGTGAKHTNDTSASACGVYRNDGQVRLNGAVINVELPRNPSEFAKGLGGRPCILPDQGMLFAFTEPGQYAFWMKDMKFPIDIIWIGSDHKIAAMEIDEQPSTYPDKFVNQKPAQYVLEVKAGLSKSLHLGLGTPVSF